MVKSENKMKESDHHTKHSQVHARLQQSTSFQTLRDISQMLGTYKNPSDSTTRTLTHIIECYDCTCKLLQTVDVHSQPITKYFNVTQSTYSLHYKLPVFYVRLTFNSNCTLSSGSI